MNASCTRKPVRTRTVKRASSPTRLTNEEKKAVREAISQVAYVSRDGRVRVRSPLRSPGRRTSPLGRKTIRRPTAVARTRARSPCRTANPAAARAGKASSPPSLRHISRKAGKAACTASGGPGKARRSRMTPPGAQALAGSRLGSLRGLTKAEKKRVLHDYYASGSHDAEVNAIVSEAMRKLIGRGDQIPRNAAVVFDIDDTVLGTHPSYRSWAIARLPKGMRERMPDHFHPPIKPVVQLYKALIDAGVAVLILTGRYARHKGETFENLRWAGFDKWHDAAFREQPEERMTARDFKERRRREWAERHGWHIIGCVGDQLSDLEGDHAGHTVYIPNPAYVIQ